jgi:hypothetical protein
MQGAEERRLSRMGNTSQGGAIEGNAADDALVAVRVDLFFLTPKGMISIMNSFTTLLDLQRK